MIENYRAYFKNNKKFVKEGNTDVRVYFSVIIINTN